MTTFVLEISVVGRNKGRNVIAVRGKGCIFAVPILGYNHFIPIEAMYLDSEKKKEIFAKYGQSNTDTGSPESQIALFSFRISHLTEHLKSNRKDYSTERALKIMVGKRRSLLDYVKAKDVNRYRAIIKELGLRK